MQNQTARIIIIGFFVAILQSTIACEPQYQSLDIRQLSTPPQPFATQIRNEQITIPEGVATLISAVPISRNSEEYPSHVQVDLWSEQPRVLLVQPAAKTFEFVLIGVEQGQTCIPVEIDGAKEECIPARVTPAVGSNSP